MSAGYQASESDLAGVDTRDAMHLFMARRENPLTSWLSTMIDQLPTVSRKRAWHNHAYATFRSTTSSAPYTVGRRSRSPPSRRSRGLLRMCGGHTCAFSLAGAIRCRRRFRTYTSSIRLLSRRQILTSIWNRTRPRKCAIRQAWLSSSGMYIFCPGEYAQLTRP
jgi:hypothetical protein